MEKKKNHFESKWLKCFVGQPPSIFNAVEKACHSHALSPQWNIHQLKKKKTVPSSSRPFNFGRFVFHSISYSIHIQYVMETSYHVKNAEKKGRKERLTSESTSQFMFSNKMLRIDFTFSVDVTAFSTVLEKKSCDFNLIGMCMGACMVCLLVYELLPLILRVMTIWRCNCPFFIRAQ